MKHRETKILLNCSHIILCDPWSFAAPACHLLNFTVQYRVLGTTWAEECFVRTVLPVLASSPVLKIDLPPPLKDTKSVVEMSDIAECSVGENFERQTAGGFCPPQTPAESDHHCEPSLRALGS